MSRDLPLEDAAASWARMLRAANRSPHTIRNYLNAVRTYSAWCEARGEPATIASLTRDLIVAHLEHNLAEYKPGTAANRFKQLRAFCSFLVAEEDLPASPMAGLEAPVVPEDPVEVFTDGELQALLGAARSDPSQFNARRDEALLRMLLDSGTRISELAGMLLAECDLDAGAAWVVGKGGRRRVVMFGAKTARALDRYLRVRRAHRLAHLPALWLTQRAGMSADGLDDRLKVIARRAGIGDVHAHRFRHTWAHDFLGAGGHEQNLKRLAGWRSDAMLARYGASQADARARAEARRLARGDRV